MDNTIGIYIHIPFCSNKCDYCNFYSIVPNGKIIQSYIDAVCNEIMFYKNQNRIVNSIYFGGGTPNLINFKYFVKIIETTKQVFEISEDVEITVEMNPELIDEEIYELLLVGVNRLSIGIQSFIERDLRFLGRRYSSVKAQEVIKIAKKQKFKNISVDFILGLKDQTANDVLFNAKLAEQLGIDHVSSYLLKIEPQTKFNNNIIFKSLPDDDIIANMYKEFSMNMNKLGFKQYEISNYAKDNKTSRHNLKYWECKEYIGVGVNAHSYFNDVRYYVVSDVDRYIQYVGCADQYSKGLCGMLPPHLNNESCFKTEKADDSKIIYYMEAVDKFLEYIMLGLRTTVGIEIKTLEKIDSERCEKFMKKYKKKYGEPNQFTKLYDGRIYLTLDGFLLSNHIISDLLY